MSIISEFWSNIHSHFQDSIACIKEQKTYRPSQLTGNNQRATCQTTASWIDSVELSASNGGRPTVIR